MSEQVSRGWLPCNRCGQSHPGMPDKWCTAAPPAAAAAQPGERERALADAEAACEAIRDECYKSWQSFAEDEQKKTGKGAAKAERHASESYYAYETANDCAKAIQRLRAAAPQQEDA